eukprot:gnl/TRDRNA2_/TRDRNA2_55027_c0_seq1.p1 gnl/TRDRNA2_/TRDRNA2_55027_c0~~gnl/TRDRNA2_/TRDRNA2_55027_c0_seq1.p1  ORF type:complete len:429 (+),score=80.93 gnl/TRDRNA2_/TRDRNA2_55027_c0_seq1:32-1288(+)
MLPGVWTDWHMRFRMVCVCIAAVLASMGANAWKQPEHCTLGSLQVWGGERVLKLVPEFSPNVYWYKAVLDYWMHPLSVDAVAAGSDGCEARREDSGHPIAPGGSGDVSIAVNGADPKVYVIEVERRTGKEVGLHALSISDALLSPALNSSVRKYTATFSPPLSDEVVISCVPLDADQKVQVEVVVAYDLSVAVNVSEPSDEFDAYMMRKPPMQYPTLNFTIGKLVEDGARLLLRGGTSVALPTVVQVTVTPARNRFIVSQAQRTMLPRNFTIVLKEGSLLREHITGEQEGLGKRGNRNASNETDRNRSNSSNTSVGPVWWHEVAKTRGGELAAERVSSEGPGAEQPSSDKIPLICVISLITGSIAYACFLCHEELRLILYDYGVPVPVPARAVVPMIQEDPAEFEVDAALLHAAVFAT